MTGVGQWGERERSISCVVILRETVIRILICAVFCASMQRHVNSDQVIHVLRARCRVDSCLLAAQHSIGNQIQSLSCMQGLTWFPGMLKQYLLQQLLVAATARRSGEVRGAEGWGAPAEHGRSERRGPAHVAHGAAGAGAAAGPANQRGLRPSWPHPVGALQEPLRTASCALRCRGRTDGARGCRRGSGSVLQHTLLGPGAVSGFSLERRRNLLSPGEAE